MNRIGIPLSADQIPAGTGLVQSVECRGIENRYSKNFAQKPQPLDQPVTAQIVTFSNGIRQVCCLYANDVLGNGEYYCQAGTGESEERCIYAWKRPKTDSKK